MCRLFRVECIQADETILLRKDRKRRRKVVKWVDLVVHLSERVETFKYGVILQLGQAVHWNPRAYKLVFKRLYIEQLVSNDRATNSHARSGRIQTHDRPVSGARSWKEILKVEMKFIVP